MDRNSSSDGSTPGNAGTGSSFGDAGHVGRMGSPSGDGAQPETGGFADRARDIGGVAKDKLADVGGVARDKLADVGSATRERASHLRESVADALASSADKLRHRGTGQGGSLGLATSSGDVVADHDGRMSDAATRVAGGMDATADWLRDIDVDGLKSGIEHQIKEHPGRTLLIAVGLGYLLGKALRR